MWVVVIGKWTWIWEWYFIIVPTWEIYFHRIFQEIDIKAEILEA